VLRQATIDVQRLAKSDVPHSWISPSRRNTPPPVSKYQPQVDQF